MQQPMAQQQGQEALNQQQGQQPAAQQGAAVVPPGDAAQPPQPEGNVVTAAGEEGGGADGPPQPAAGLEVKAMAGALGMAPPAATEAGPSRKRKGESSPERAPASAAAAQQAQEAPMLPFWITRKVRHGLRVIVRNAAWLPGGVVLRNSNNGRELRLVCVLLT